LASERGEVFADETTWTARRWQRHAADIPDAMDNLGIVPLADRFFQSISIFH